MYIKSAPIQYNLILDSNQPQKKLLLAPDITCTLWRLLKGLYFYKVPGSKYYFDLLKQDCSNC